MSKKRSQHAHPRFDNLYRLPGQPCWIYRRYSAEKRKSFYHSTGLSADERNAAAAYKVGVEAFNKWLGKFIPAGGDVRVRDIARQLLSNKDDPTIADSTLEQIRIEVEKHIIPAFGHLKPERLTAEVWKTYQREERKRPREKIMPDKSVRKLPPRTTLFGTRKALKQVLKLAKSLGYIAEVPELELNDPESAPPRYIPKADVLRIIRLAGRIDSYVHRGTVTKVSRYRAVPVKLLAFIMWKQGARPTEILQYRWEMIRWDQGAHGTIEIPGAITKTRRARAIPLNSKVARLAKFLFGRSRSPWIFPSNVIPGDRIHDLGKAWANANRRAGLDFTIYNLRDTWITDRLIAGKSDTFVAKYCDTSPEMIRRRYAVAVRSTMEGVAE